MSFRAAVLVFGGGVLMSKKRPQIHLNVAELVLFDNDMTPIQPKTGSCMKARPKGYLRANLKNHGGKHRDFAWKTWNVF